MTTKLKQIFDDYVDYKNISRDKEVAGTVIKEIIKIIDKRSKQICNICEREKLNYSTTKRIYCTKNHDAIKEFYKRQIYEDLKQSLQESLLEIKGK